MSETVLVSSISYPSFVPSQSILVSNISPAPSSYAFIAHSIASIPISTRPPFLKMFQPLPSSLLFASMATTTHWLPNFIAASDISSGFKATLSAPSLKTALKSSTVLIPPPTVNGINTVSATLLTISILVALASEDAVISRNTSSSAPALS